MEEWIKLDSVDKYNKIYGLETLHPMVAVIDLSQATQWPEHLRINYGIYALFLKETKCGDITYGRQPYDYGEGTIVCFAPGQAAAVDMLKDARPNAHGLLFHPDFIRGTMLGQEIKKYSFFSYETREALHLSESERDTIMDCLQKIDAELRHNIDKHSRRLITANIGLLLDYCMRFYERQFASREKLNNDVLARFEQLLNGYWDSGAAKLHGLPTVKYFADKLCLSPNYFGDLIKSVAGRSAQECIQSQITEMAKEAILNPRLNTKQIADMLGFQYPQHFSRFFKKQVGCTPKEYRAMT